MKIETLLLPSFVPSYQGTSLSVSYKGSACGYAHIILHKELLVLIPEGLQKCFAEQVFLLDLARVQSLPSAAPTREEPRDAVSSGHVMCITFSLSRQAENLAPRGRKEEEHERASHF